MSRRRTFADVLADGFQKGIAKAGAHVAREVAREIGGVAVDLEKEASCTCVPVLVKLEDESVETVHQKGCPAR